MHQAEAKIKVHELEYDAIKRTICTELEIDEATFDELVEVRLRIGKELWSELTEAERHAVYLNMRT